MDDQGFETPNPLRRAVRRCWWVAGTAAALAVLPFALAGVLDDLMGDLRFVLVILGGTVAFCALLAGWLMLKRVGAFDSLLRDEAVLARWTYSPEEWQRYAAAEHRTFKNEKRWLYGVVSGIAVLVAVVLVGVDLEDNAVLAAAIAGGAVLFAAVGEWSVQRAYRRNLTPHGSARVGRHAAILNGVLYDWSGWQSRLEGCELLPGDPSCVAITYSFRVRHGRQEHALRVPVPAGRDDEARRVVATLMGG